MYKCMHACIHECRNTCMHACMHVYMHAHTHLHVRSRTCTHKLTPPHSTHTHVHTGAVHCMRHRSRNEVNLLARLCQAPGCSKRATFGHSEGDRSGLAHCGVHKTAGGVDPLHPAPCLCVCARALARARACVMYVFANVTPGIVRPPSLVAYVCAYSHLLVYILRR